VLVVLDSAVRVGGLQLPAGVAVAADPAIGVVKVAREFGPEGEQEAAEAAAEETEQAEEPAASAQEQS